MDIIYIDFDILKLNIKNGAYKFIGKGSGRLVFDLGTGYVAKAAKNKKGVAQNKAEYQISSADNTNIFAKVLLASDDFEFVIMEKADKIKSISDVLKYFNVKKIRDFLKTKELKDISANHTLILGDLCRSANWGEISGRPVIIDYGFTLDVKRKHYTLFKFRKN